MLLASARGAIAQSLSSSGSRRFPVEVVKVQFGFNDIMTVERWTPITVWVTSNEQAFTGALIIDYTQDPTQSANIIIPFSTTPGKTTPIEAAAVLPAMCDKLKLTITDGRRFREYKYGSFSADALPLPQLGGYAGRILVVGESTAPEAFPLGAAIADTLVSDYTAGAEAIETEEVEADPVPGEQPTAPPHPLFPGQPVPKQQDIWARLNHAPITPNELPMNWMAYEGFDLVVGRADELASADPRARAALMTWVQAGGRLLVEVDPAGNTWRQFLAAGPAGDVIGVAQQSQLQPGESLASILKTTRQGGAEEPPPASFKGRALTLTPQGAKDGWTIEWTCSAPSDATPATEAQPAGLVASGPIGAGMVTLLGIDPQRIPPALSAFHTRLLWRPLLLQSLPDRINADLSAQDPYYQYQWSSGGDSTSSKAISAALNRVSSVPPLGHGVFILIALSMLALVLMIGPIDAILLKRFGLSQRSWLTALTWIAVASIIGYFAPTAMRSGTTYFSRATIIDTICNEDGNPIHTWQTGVTGIFGGKPTSIPLPKAQQGRWWRGVSPLNWYAASGRAFSPLSLPIASDPDNPLQRQAAPNAISVGQWTFRTLMDQVPGQEAPPSAVGARLSEADGALHVTFTNLPPDATISRAMQYECDRSVWSELDPPVDGRGRMYEIKKPSALGALAHLEELPDYWNIPLARDRVTAFHRRAATAQWVFLVLEVSNLDPDLDLSMQVDTKVTTSSVIRLLVPVNREALDE